MQIFLVVLTIISVFIATLLIAAALLKKDYAIVRDIIINKPNDEVFNYIKFIKNQDHYSKWVMMDPNMKKIFKGTDGTVGFVYGWNGNKKAGEGEQEITRIINAQQINTEVRFVRPFAATGYLEMKTTPISNTETKLIWHTGGRTPYPMNVMNGFYHNMLGKDMEISLSTLKQILEKDKINTPETTYASTQA